MVAMPAILNVFFVAILIGLLIALFKSYQNKELGEATALLKKSIVIGAVCFPIAALLIGVI